MSEDKPLFEVEAQPPTPEEIERQRVREEYRAKLAEKLKDPEFRKIEGFPIGTDEAILALSDPPYYTACPNPFIEEWLKEHGKPFDPDTDDYHREPFAADVSEGKTDPIYSAHGYHTKVPHKAIMRYILHYTEPGDLVLDGFCGSGMCGVAAFLCGEKGAVTDLGYAVTADGVIEDSDGALVSRLGARRALLSDLSPAATSITAGYTLPQSSESFRKSFNELLDFVGKQVGWLYQTLHGVDEATTEMLAAGLSRCMTEEESRQYVSTLVSDGHKFGHIDFTVWSEAFLCPSCSKDIVFGEVEHTQSDSNAQESFSCPSCGTVVTKRTAAKSTRTVFDQAIGQTRVEPVLKPIKLVYSAGGKKHERKPSSYDLALLELSERFPIATPFPTVKMMDKGAQWGDLWRAGYHGGITHSHHFYLNRPLRMFSSVVEFVQARNNLDERRALRFLVFQYVGGFSRMNRYSPHHYSQNNRGLSGTLYCGSTIAEVSPTYAFGGKGKRLERVFNDWCRTAVSIVSTQSTTELGVQPNSIDYIFTDPPFGGNLPYSELNFLTESWLGVRTHTAEEAITSEAQHKDLLDYQRLMTSCFQRYYVALKPGRWMTVEFHNSSNAVWNTIQESLWRTGFVVADVRVLDKASKTKKQISGANAVNVDLVISCYKPTVTFTLEFEREAGTEHAVVRFLREHLSMLPIIAKQETGLLESVAERTKILLYDRMVAFHLMQGLRIPLSAGRFYEVLEEHFYERDAMYFLAEQVASYDAMKAAGFSVEQLAIFVKDEKSAVQWVRVELQGQSQTLGELTPKFMQASRDWGQHEVMPELRDLLHQYFIRVEDENWVVPDPENEKHLEEVRRKAMLREFQEYVRRSGQLKLFRTEALLAGFAHCWESKQYDVIVGVCEKIPPKLLLDIQDLVMFYDIAKERAPGKITQFEFKWE